MGDFNQLLDEQTSLGHEPEPFLDYRNQKSPWADDKYLSSDAIFRRLSVDVVYRDQELKNLDGDWIRGDFCHRCDSRKSSAFCINVKSLAWKCWSCDSKGSALDYVRDALDQGSISRAWKYLKKLAGFDGSSKTSSKPPIKRKRPTVADVKKSSNKTSLIAPMIIKPLQPGREVSAWIEKRFPGIELEAFQGLMALTEPSSLGWASQRGRGLIFPQYDIERPSKIIGGRLRATRPKLKPPSKALKGTRSGKYGSCLGRLDHALEAAAADHHLILLEGEPDFATARAAGFENSIGMPGTGSGSKIVRGILETTDFKGSLIVATHNDSNGAGQKAFQAICDLLKTHNQGERIKLYSVSFEPDLDLNDELMSEGIDAVRERLESALFVKTVETIETIETIDESEKKRASWDNRQTLPWLNEYFQGNPAPESKAGFGKLNKTVHCRNANKIIKGTLSINRSGSSFRAIPVDKCNGVFCLSCREQIITRNKVSFAQWKEQDSIEMVTVSLPRELVSDHYDLRSEIVSKTAYSRRKIEVYGFIDVICPGSIKVFIAAEKDEDRALLVSKVLAIAKKDGIAETSIKTLDPSEAIDEFMTAAKSLAETVHQIEIDQDLASLESDPWLTQNHSGRKQISKAKGLMLPFQSSQGASKSSKDPVEDADDDAQTVKLHVFGKDSGILNITTKPLTIPNEIRTFFGHGREKLWQDVNLARLWINEPGFFVGKLKAAFEDLEARFGFHESLKDAYWYEELRFNDRELIRSIIADACHKLDDPIPARMPQSYAA